MGKWNHRWIPRRNYRNETSDFNLSHQYQTLTPDDWKSNVPWWEKQFCQQVGSVPWKKVLVAKKYMHCHESVVKWNDSAIEETFHNAKKRFLAEINGLPFDIPLPDPSMYIGEIDWNPVIDPKLIVELDREFFNPDEDEKNKKLEDVEVRSRRCNNWELSILKATEAALKDSTQHRNQWDKLIGEESNRKISNAAENPWEQSNTHIKGAAANDNAWLNCNEKSWGWDHEGKVHDERLPSKNFDSQCAWQNVGSAKEVVWCSSRNTNGVQNQINNDRDGGWRPQPGQNISSRDCGVSGGSQWRKREGSLQYSSRHKSPRFHHGDFVGDHY